MPSIPGKPKRIDTFAAFVSNFWSKVDKTSNPNGCWIFTRGKNQKGYGVDNVAKKFGLSCYAHVIAWVLTKGRPVPKGKQICHDCPGGDNHACCNPDHLWAGSHAENQADASAKGQAWHKLTKVTVLRIRRRYAKGGISMRAVARKFRLDHGYVRQIILRKVWRHI